MLRTSSFRPLIALFLAAWMPFCCCSLHTLASVCQACEKHGDDDAGGGCHGHGTADQKAADTGHHAQASSPGHQDEPDRDQGPCTCDKSKQTTISVEKSTIDLPAPVLVFVLPEWEPSWLPHGDSLPLSSESWALRKPATSLLRQHCALIV